MVDVTPGRPRMGLNEQQQARLDAFERKASLTDMEIGELAALAMCARDESDRARCDALRRKFATR